MIERRTTMGNIEFLTGICQSVLNPLPAPITEQEKLDILAYERDMEEADFWGKWPPDEEPYDIALEL
jgi:hypothetical protein